MANCKWAATEYVKKIRNLESEYERLTGNEWEGVNYRTRVQPQVRHFVILAIVIIAWIAFIAGMFRGYRPRTQQLLYLQVVVMGIGIGSTLAVILIDYFFDFSEKSKTRENVKILRYTTKILSELDEAQDQLYAVLQQLWQEEEKRLAVKCNRLTQVLRKFSPQLGIEFKRQQLRCTTHCRHCPYYVKGEYCRSERESCLAIMLDMGDQQPLPLVQFESSADGYDSLVEFALDFFPVFFYQKIDRSLHALLRKEIRTMLEDDVNAGGDAHAGE